MTCQELDRVAIPCIVRISTMKILYLCVVFCAVLVVVSQAKIVYQKPKQEKQEWIPGPNDKPVEPDIRVFERRTIV